MALPTNSVGLQFIASIIASDDVKAYHALGNCEYLFEHTLPELKLYSFLDDHIKKYGKVPSREAFEGDTGYKLPVVDDTPEYFKDKVFDRHIHRAMILSSQQAEQALKTKNVKQAFEFLKKMVHGIGFQKIQPYISDFKSAHSEIMKSMAAKISGDDNSLEFGWATLDKMSAGLRCGDLVSFTGRPGQGKTFLLLFTAMHIWKQQKQPVLFVTTEMSRMDILERLAAMHTEMPYDWVKSGAIPTFPIDRKKQFSDALSELENGEVSFYVADAQMTSTVKDIHQLCSQLKPAIVIVDGAYLLTIEGKFGKYEKIGEICRELKNLATHRKIPVIASWQLNRESKKTKTVGVEHIAGSDEVGQLSSIALGFFEEENISTINRRKVEILKGRTGEMGVFYTNWNFQKMSFAEIEPDNEFEVA
jgi:replicative DNA helicase